MLQNIVLIWTKSASFPKIQGHAELLSSDTILTRRSDSASNSFTAAAKGTKTIFCLSGIAKRGAQVRKVCFIEITQKIVEEIRN